MRYPDADRPSLVADTSASACAPAPSDDLHTLEKDLLWAMTADDSTNQSLDGQELEEWAVEALYTCGGCQSRLPVERLARYCPNCGVQIVPMLTPVPPAEQSEAGLAAPNEPQSAWQWEGDGAWAQDELSSPVAPVVAPWPTRGAVTVTRADILAVIAYWQSVLELFPELPLPGQADNDPAAQFEAAMRGQPPPIPFAGVYQSSSIVTAYASALYRLGAHYERQLGAGSNTQEAVRCYLKSARLGNVEALNRVEADPAIGAVGWKHLR